VCLKYFGCNSIFQLPAFRCELYLNGGGQLIFVSVSSIDTIRLSTNRNAYFKNNNNCVRTSSKGSHTENCRIPTRRQYRRLYCDAFISSVWLPTAIISRKQIRHRVANSNGKHADVKVYFSKPYQQHGNSGSSSSSSTASIIIIVSASQRSRIG